MTIILNLITSVIRLLLLKMDEQSILTVMPWNETAIYFQCKTNWNWKFNRFTRSIWNLRTEFIEYTVLCIQFIIILRKNCNLHGFNALLKFIMFYINIMVSYYIFNLISKVSVLPALVKSIWKRKLYKNFKLVQQNLNINSNRNHSNNYINRKHQRDARVICTPVIKPVKRNSKNNRNICPLVIRWLGYFFFS